MKLDEKTLAELRRLAEEVRNEYDPPRPAWSWYDIGWRDACDEILRRLFPTAKALKSEEE